MFYEKCNSESNRFISWVETDWSFSKSGQTRHEFWKKRRPLEPFFRKLLTLPSRKMPFEQLSCFTFCLIRPLRASKSHYQKTGQFYPKTSSLFLTWFYVLIRAHYLNRPQWEPNISQAAISNVPFHHHIIRNHPCNLMQTLGYPCTKLGFAWF